MIDHVSVGVTDLNSAAVFYDLVFEPLGISKLVEKPGTVGFGKRYPEFWLNYRPGKEISTQDNGTHICLRASSIEAVNEFYKKAIELGARSSGEPGYRIEYHEGYYAAFIKDVDQNHIEVVTFVR
jgi:catechol 2,3-dioxygenase-like lactoylglutathione lyase family enzyme